MAKAIHAVMAQLDHADLEPGAPLAAVAAARDLSRLADQLMRTAVDGVRTRRHTWQEIGEVLGTTRQAAFQRFGRPLDPRTGALMVDDLLPGATGRATALLADLAAGDYPAVRRELSEEMASRLDARRLAAAWAQMAGLVGAYEGMGRAHAYQAGDVTVVDVSLSFEAGDVTGRVSYDRDGRVVGLFLLPDRSRP